MIRRLAPAILIVLAFALLFAAALWPSPNENRKAFSDVPTRCPVSRPVPYRLPNGLWVCHAVGGF